MNHCPRGQTWVLLFILCAFSHCRGSSVLISEIFYHPATTNVLEEFIELQNSDSRGVDLTGWRITKGVHFDFPVGTIIPPGGYLVVASDATTFQSKHPGVSNWVAGWTGTLSDDGDHLLLEDAGGLVVNEVSYAPSGDWAIRRLGGPDSYKKIGWEWYAPHDGLGYSLELVNGALPNQYALNWAPSSVLGGTPGKANSAASSDAPPIIWDVGHFPPIPKSNESVVVHARMVDEQKTGLALDVFYRKDGVEAYTKVSMSDDGKHGDGIAKDGLYAAVLPAQAKGTIVEFFLVATDAAGHQRTYPAVVPSGNTRTANLLYQVDEEPLVGTQPLYRLVTTQAEYDYLKGVWSGAPESDATVSGTFIGLDAVIEGGSTVQVRYGCDFRNRGHGTRVSVPHNFRVDFPKDRPWQGRVGVNLNTQFTVSQMLGSTLMRRSRIPMPESRPVKVRVNGQDLAAVGSPQFGFYVANELVDSRFVARQIPQDSGGNLYRGIRDVYPGNPKADLAWHGSSFSSYTNAYFKQNHTDRNDWQDLVHLTDVLNNSTDETYASAVRKVADVEEWMRYFAINTLLDNQETALATGYGDDFAIYRGVADTRFWVLPYDMDSLMGQGSRATTYGDGLFRMTGSGNHLIPALERFMKHPEFAPIYYASLVQLIADEFESTRMNPLLDGLKLSFGSTAQIDAAIGNMKAFNASHVAYVQSLIPRALSLTNSLTVQSGYPHTVNSKIAVGGRSDAVRTWRVLVNGVPAAWSAWEASWSLSTVELHPGLNRILVQALDALGNEFDQTTNTVWYDDGNVANVSGTLSGSVIWSAANGPYQVSGTVTVASGATLTIQPGTTVYFGSAADLVVASGGRVLAEGTAAAPIRFTRLPGSTASWGGVVLRGGAGTPENRLSHVHLEYNGGTAIEVAGATVELEYLTFGTTEHQYLALDGASFVVSHCVFPTTTAPFELVHGTQGIKPGGHGIIRECFFGTTTGYNDIIDFTGGNRATQPIIQFYNNVFIGASDDILDLDNTDAWIEGNIFLHAHKNGTPDSSSAISGGNDTGQPSEITIVGNLFFDCDQAATAKEQNFYVLLNNTVVHQTKVGGSDTVAAVVNFADEGKKEAAGMYLEGNIIVDAENLVRFLTTAQVTFTNNVLPMAWAGTGGGNRVTDPMLRHYPTVAETQFKTWEEAQILWQWFGLQPGSPAAGADASGHDLGAVHFLGVSVSGEPTGKTRSSSATLHVGFNRTGQGITTAGWPEGAGYTDYRWRLDDGLWSEETPISNPIQLQGLAEGVHHVDVVGKRDAGMYQNDPLLGETAVITRSSDWTVDPNSVAPLASTIRINEVLAKNVGTFTSGETTPDLVELFNPTPNTVDLSGVGITDDDARPYRFKFPAGTMVPPGGFLVLMGDSDTNVAGLHLGFGVSADGDRLSMRGSEASGGVLLDSVQFGVQVADFSIGRWSDGQWGLCVPTFGKSNSAALRGNAEALKINEWLANGRFTFAEDFVELFNPEALPIELEGLFLSDAPGNPARHRFPALSFISPKSCLWLVADGDNQGRANHLIFKLASESGTIQLSDAELNVIDTVSYGPQQTDRSQGRSPNGAATLQMFKVPTPGALNAGSVGGTESVSYVERGLLGFRATWKYDANGVDLGSNWRPASFSDASWKSGGAPFGLESSTPYPYVLPIQTPLSLTAPGGARLKTYYFRTHFDVGETASGFSLYATNYLDDGAVFYINGIRVGALRISDNPATYASDAVIQPTEGQMEVLKLSSESLVPGDNVLAVEVHQSGNSSTDVMFAMALGAVQAVTNSIGGNGSPLVLNEVLVRNQSFTNVGGVACSWVELFNPTKSSVSLADLSLSDDPSIPRKWVCPAGIAIPALGYRVICLDSTRPSSSTNAAFSPSKNGGALFLFDSLANGGVELDAVVYGTTVVDFSVGRVPDGVGDWTLAIPSDGSANLAAGLGSPSALRVNEWMADPVSGADWFELYNTDAAPVALEGLYVTDDLGDRTKSPMQPLSFIGSGRNGYLQLFADKQTGANHVDFKLSKSGSELGLFAASGLELDALNFGVQLTGVSEGRLPDGASAVQRFPNSATPGTANAIGPVILDTDGDGIPDEWELAHGLNPLLNDALEDLDGDGLNNLAEYLAGTDPNSAASGLALQVALDGEEGLMLSFKGIAGRKYAIEYRDALSTAGQWQRVLDVPIVATSGSVSILVQRLGSDLRFYRVLIPSAQ